MKSLRNTLLASALLGASCVFSHAAVLYTYAGQTVNEANVSLPGLSLSRTTTDTGTLYFKYTVTNPASNYTNENYFAGMSFYDGVYDGPNERLGVGNGWGAWAYSAFGSANTDLNNPDPATPGHAVKLVESSDITTIVLRVDFNSLANDNVTVWLNPNLSLTEAAQSASRTTYFTADATFTNIFLREGGGGGGWAFSDIAIAENPTDAGFFAVPEPSAALLGTFGMLALLRRRR
jgi:outer membrane lipoprotein-sorting protein